MRRRSPFLPPPFLAALLVAALATHAQQTLGGITGNVTDPSGRTLSDVEVNATAEETRLTRKARSNAQGTYTLNDLPIGPYTLIFRHNGFSTQRFPGILVQADRTVTLPAQLAVGAVNESITVDINPLLNAVDTTNGYVLDKQQIESIPLPTGSFTGVAILSPGVNAELPGGTGANSGLGNQPIWANGQRDTSNSFSLNGIDASNLFNGKSTSQVGSARVINSTGVSTSLGAGGVIQSVASIYLTIGNAIPTPAPETLQEVQVNASMYDAQQGSTSGAHISLSTTPGTNKFHGTLYGHRGTNWINAAPFFFKNDDNVPDNQKNPALHRWIAGGTFGGPIIKNKLFGFVAYQHLHVSDQEIGDGFLDVPVGLGDTNRTAAGFANVVTNSFCSSSDQEEFGCTPFTAGQMDRTALALFNSPALPGEPGRWLIPNDSGVTPTPTHPYNAFLPGTARFKADLAVANLDYNATAKDTLSLKYFYQHDPTIAPYAFSSVPGFTEHLDSGAQVFSIINTYLVKPTLSTTETMGFIREKNWADNEQPFSPSSIPGGSLGTVAINTFGSTYFPGVSIYNVLGDYAFDLPSPGILNIGPNALGQSSNTGVFQNRWQPKADAIWTLGRHTVSFGANYSHTQLNTIDHRTNAGTIATDDFSQFAQGQVTPGSSSTGFYVSSFLQGNANRYYRANQLGTYVQDKFQITPRLSLTAGIRYDWNGGLSEKYGRLFNFDPSLYQYSASGDTILNSGLIIAHNNANGTMGVSNTTLTGRQWGIGPRLGAAWQPEKFHNNLVVRTGFGMYYDRGELFSYFSPGYAIGTVTGGPFGVNQQLPFVTAQSCPKKTRVSPTRATSPPAAARATAALRMRSRAISQTLTAPSKHRHPLIRRPPTSTNICRTSPRSKTTASPSHLASTTAPTSCPTPTTTRSTFSGSRARTSPSNSVTSATWAVIRSFLFPSISRASPTPAVPFTAKSTPTATPSPPTMNPATSFRSTFRTVGPTGRTTKVATSIIAFPMSATLPNPSPTEPPASTPTTRSPRILRSA